MVLGPQEERPGQEELCCPSHSPGVCPGLPHILADSANEGGKTDTEAGSSLGSHPPSSADTARGLRMGPPPTSWWA